jgi:hypothetical protein
MTKTIRVRQVAPIALMPSETDGEVYVRTGSGATWRVEKSSVDTGSGVHELLLVAVDPHDIPLDATVPELMRPPYLTMVEQDA